MIQLEELPLADLVSFLELQPPNLPYKSLTGTPTVTGSTVLGYTEFTSPVGLPSGQGSAVTVVSAPAITFDGSTEVSVEFFAPQFANTSGNQLFFELHDGTSFLGIVAVATTNISNGGGIVYGKRVFTPAAGSVTYAIKGYNGFGGPYSVNAGAGGSGTLMPGFIRIVSA